MLVLSTLSHQIAVALLNVRQYERSQQTLPQSQQQQGLLNTVIDNIPDWIFVKDTDHRFILVNQSFAKALGRETQDFIGKNDLDLGFPEEMVMGNPQKGIQGYWWDDQRVLDTGEPQVIKGEQNKVDDVLHIFDVYKAALYDNQGKIWGLMGYARDVTDHERLLSELEGRAQREQILRQITAQVRGSMDPEIIMKSAVRELGVALGRKTFVHLGIPAQSNSAPGESSNDGQKVGRNGGNNGVQPIDVGNKVVEGDE
jgi:PAS domain S-box-containing protein